MTTYAPQVGDLVDAEYIESMHETKPAILHGIVTSVGQWEGQPTHSVSGFDRFGNPGSTSSSTMPVHFVASGSTELARDLLRRRYAKSTGTMRYRLEAVADVMGMSL